MIKFNCLIHKETNTVIKYDVWLKSFKENKGFRFTKMNLYEEMAVSSRAYDAIELLTSDDFEIIYNSEFTTSDLNRLYANDDDIDLKIKINGLLGEREYIKLKYRIEV